MLSYIHKEEITFEVDFLRLQSINWAIGKYRQQVFTETGFHLLPITYIFRSHPKMNATEAIQTIFESLSKPQKWRLSND